MARHLFRREPLLAAIAPMTQRGSFMWSFFLLWLFVCIATTAKAADKVTLKFSKCVNNDQHGTNVLVLDLTKDVTAANANDVAFLLDQDQSPLLVRLDALLNACPDVDLASARVFLKDVQTAAPPSRLIGHAGDHLKVYAFVIGRLVNVTIHEIPRKRAVVDDIGTLIDLLKQLRSAGGAAAATVTVWTADYVLQEQLALAEVNVVPYTDNPHGGEPIEGSAIKVAEIVTGLTEHFRLSANVPVNSVKKLDYDQTKKQVVLKDTPREFMVGVDWYLGDVLARPPLYDWRRLGVKGLIRFSKQPLDALGLVLAYRASPFSVIGGRTWSRLTQKTGVNPDGSDQIKRSYKGAWQFGLGFDLKTAKDWLTGKSSSAKAGGK